VPRPSGLAGVPAWFPDRRGVLGGLALDLDVHDAPRPELHRDAAVQVGAVGRGPGSREVVEDIGVGMPVRVVGADADERDVRHRGGEEPGGVRVAAVMRDLERTGAQRLGVAQHERLGEHLGVAGQEHASVRVVDAKHEGDLVQVGADRTVAGRRQHDDLRRAEREPVAGHQGHDRDGLGARGRIGLVRGRGGAVCERIGADEQRADVEPPQDRREPAGVVVVRVGQRDRVEAADPSVTQIRERRAVRPTVVQHARHRLPLARRHLDQHGVALTDVELRDGQRVDAGSRGDHRHEGERRRGGGEGPCRPGRAPADQQCCAEGQGHR
jgi:hypothetical protein